MDRLSPPIMASDKARGKNEGGEGGRGEGQCPLAHKITAWRWGGEGGGGSRGGW